jgi:hypothetical protein
MYLPLEVAPCHGDHVGKPWRRIMKAELTALDIATVESEWLREFLMDLPMVEKPMPTILLNCDNQTVIVKVNNSKDNAKSSRHIK